MTVLSPLLRLAGGARVQGAVGGADNRPGPAETTAGLDFANQTMPVATTTCASTSQLRPAPTSAGRKLTAQPRPSARDFDVVPGICVTGEVSMNYQLVAAAISALLAGGAVWIGMRLFRRDRAWLASALTVLVTALGLTALLRRRRGGWR